MHTDLRTHERFTFLAITTVSAISSRSRTLIEGDRTPIIRSLVQRSETDSIVSLWLAKDKGVVEGYNSVNGTLTRNATLHSVLGRRALIPLRSYSALETGNPEGGAFTQQDPCPHSEVSPHLGLGV
jgi:hypothetical protein